MILNSRRLVVIFLLLLFAAISCQKDPQFQEVGTKLFTLVSTEYSRLDFKNPVKQTRENNHMVNVEFISGAGVGVGDINNDGLQDVFLTGNQVKDQLFLNQGDLKFKDISLAAGISTEELWSTGVTFVDIDQDGDQDIYVCRSVYLEDEKSGNLLYINNGDLTFSEQAAEYGLADNGFSVQAAFFDFDKDGLLDMYLVNQPPSLPGQGGQLNMSMASNRLFSDKLYKNSGNGEFIDFTDQADLRNFAFGLSASIGDVNNDTWPDIYVTNDFDVPDHLYINQQNGTFKDQIGYAAKHISNFSMGSDIADYDNDGHLDIMVLDMMAEDHKRIKTHMGSMKPEEFWRQVESGGHYQYMFNTLQRNNGNGTFSDLAQLAGVTSTDWSWAPLFADFDNDGYKDLFVTNGVKYNNRLSDLTDVYDRKLDSINKVAQQQGRNPQSLIDVMEFAELAPTDKLANYMYKNNGDLTFSKKIKEWGLDQPTLSNGAAYADFDLDGDLDLIISNIDDYVYLYKNNTVENKVGNFIRFKLQAENNQSIYGTRVSLYKNNQLWQLFEVTNTRGYISKSEDIVHFGLGDVTQVDKVVFETIEGKTSTRLNVAGNQLYEVNITHFKEITKPESNSDHQLFEEVSEAMNLNEVLHVENPYDDYAKEILLPHKMSQFGPLLAVGDVNGDAKEDFFIGGSAGVSGALFIQQDFGFQEFKQGDWSEDRSCEDMGVALLDVDGDNDLDLFIVSGGNEFLPQSPELQDRLYLNDGQGHFKRDLEAVPSYLTSGSCVVPCDYDLDGDLDLFIGGRIVPGKYPQPANSHLLENRNGKYFDVTSEKAAELNQLGLVTAACWTDQNQDNKMDLVIVGEWMPVTTFIQNPNGNFEKQTAPGLEDTEGWYYAVAADDVDMDGDEDLVVGNLGLNYKYKASPQEPFEVYSHDFDNNGSLDIVLSYYEHGEIFPVRGKDCSSQQIPSFTDKFTTYEMFGNSNLLDIYGPSLNDALNLKAKTFASAFIENKGQQGFIVHPLPNIAQVSSINNILIRDFDQDGHLDLLISGNLYSSEIETPRNDAGTGMMLKGNGQGHFEPLSIKQSGFFARNDAKDMELISVNNYDVILVSNNSDYLQAIRVQSNQVEN